MLYNMLGVGTTQLYNERIVYNKKRHGLFKLGNRSFNFVRKAYVPNKLTKEFLLVDLMNNLKYLEEDKQVLLRNIKKVASELNKTTMKKLVLEYGKIETKKHFSYLLN